jgi:Domain of unknown function (DUF4388)
MDVMHEFPASAAGSLVEGYCNDFLEIATTFTQTLQQVQSRNLPLQQNRPTMERTVQGLRKLADYMDRLLGTQKPVDADAPPMASDGTLTGSNHTMPVLAVFQYLGRRRKTGTLSVDLTDEKLTFDFGDGSVVRTTTTRSADKERIGDLLIERKFVTMEQLKPYLDKASHLGGACVEAGLVSNGQLMEILELQVLRRFERVVRASEVTYSFKDGRASANDGRIRIRPFELLFEAKKLA